MPGKAAPDAGVLVVALKEVAGLLQHNSEMLLHPFRYVGPSDCDIF